MRNHQNRTVRHELWVSLNLRWETIATIIRTSQYGHPKRTLLSRPEEGASIFTCRLSGRTPSRNLQHSFPVRHRFRPGYHRHPSGSSWTSSVSSAASPTSGRTTSRSLRSLIPIRHQFHQGLNQHRQITFLCVRGYRCGRTGQASIQGEMSLDFGSSGGRDCDLRWAKAQAAGAPS